MIFLFRLLINMVAILIISYLFPRLIKVDGFWAALVAAFLLGIVNAIIRPILVLLTFPITISDPWTFSPGHQWLVLWLVSALVQDSMSMVFGELCWVPF